MKKTVLWSGVVAVLLGIGLWGGCGETDAPEGAAGVDSVVVEVVAVDSGTVLEVTQQRHDVESRSTAMGVFVTAIDSIETGGGAYWVYSVNGEKPGVAADKFAVGPGDTVRWHFRKGR